MNNYTEDNTAEKTLAIIANIVLLIGAITSVILIIMGFAYLDQYGTGELGILFLLITPGVLLASIISWGLLKVVCNISNKLTKISNTLETQTIPSETEVCLQESDKTVTEYKTEESHIKTPHDLRNSFACEKDELKAGLTAEAEGRDKDAIKIYTNLVENNTEHSEVYEKLCTLLRTTQKPEDELWAAEKWLEYVNDQPDRTVNDIINVKKRITEIQAKLDKSR